MPRRAGKDVMCFNLLIRAAVRKIGEWNDKDINGNVNKRVPNDNTIIEGFEDRMKIATGFRSGVPLKKETKKSKDVEFK